MFKHVSRGLVVEQYITERPTWYKYIWNQKSVCERVCKVVALPFSSNASDKESLKKSVTFMHCHLEMNVPTELDLVAYSPITEMSPPSDLLTRGSFFLARIPFTWEITGAFVISPDLLGLMFIHVANRALYYRGLTLIPSQHEIAIV